MYKTITAFIHLARGVVEVDEYAICYELAIMVKNKPAWRIFALLIQIIVYYIHTFIYIYKAYVYIYKYIKFNAAY